MKTRGIQVATGVAVVAAMLAGSAVNGPDVSLAAVTGPADWRGDVVALDGVDLRDDDTDLDEALGDVVRDARVVLLGDATHGSHELYAVKSRLVRYLVNEHGFDTVLLEDGVDGVEATSRYVDGKAGDVRDALGKLQQVWNSAEVGHLTGLLRRHNAGARPGKGERVSFLGADAPGPEAAVRYVDDHLRATQPRRAATVARQLACIAVDVTDLDAYARRPAAEQNRCRRAVRQVREQFRRQPARAERGLTFDLAHAGAAALPHWEVGLRMGGAELMKQLEGPLRERMLADQVTAAVERNPDGRVVVWAHNMHAGRFRNLDMPDPFGGTMHVAASLGALLTDRLGRAAVKVLGSTVGAGTFHGADAAGGDAATFAVTPFPLPEQHPDGSDTLLDTVGLEAFVLPLTDAGELAKPRPARIAVTWAWDPGVPAGSVTVNLAEAFDAVLHVRHSTPTHLQPAPAEPAGS